MACVHDSAGRSSQVQGHAETRLTFGFLGWASVRECHPSVKFSLRATRSSPDGSETTP
jgi:hypothetical protein